jgi:6-phosphogluconolactonase
VTFTPTITDPASFAEVAAHQLARAITQATEERTRVSVALSGGRGPRPVLERLAAIPGLSWRAVQIFFADERAVPPDHPDSNYRLVQESLVNRLGEAPAAVHRMRAEDPAMDRAAEEYARLLPPALDVLVLGMGDDGHTASLFPGHPEIGEEHRLVVPAMGPTPPRERLTITPLVIRAARIRIMLVSGANKAPAVARACEGPEDPFSCPAQLARDGYWIMDRPAASRLRGAPA